MDPSGRWKAAQMAYQSLGQEAPAFGGTYLAIELRDIRSTSMPNTYRPPTVHAPIPYPFTFREASMLLGALKLDPHLPHIPHANFPGDYLVDQAYELIDCTIECIKGSELDLAQTYWKSDLKGINDRLLEYQILVDSHTHYSPENHEEPREKLLRKPVIQLAKVAIPLIKFSRLFFSKLSTRGMNVKRLASLRK
ncbi:hypothetical protein H4Q26_016625 [Puccinia striiformis f. sp. tritici PST-130]|nr:hypothetical protein H4Q26_016625 [Puccinia striiformis f. sp. tritici PST-130]